MKGATIALGELGGREAAALIVDGRLDDLFIDGAGALPGTIYRGIAGRPMKGQGGIFFDTPDGPAYLRQIKGISPGEARILQVTGFPEPGKAIPVTDRVLFKSRYGIVTPGAPGINVSRAIRDSDARDAILEIAHEEYGGADGLILRSSCDGADPDAIAEDIREMSALAAAVMADTAGPAEVLVEGDGAHARAWREWALPAEVDREAGAFDRHGVLDEIEALRGPHVPLGGGASMAVEVTRALVAVDVNTGGDTSPAAGVKATLAALRALPRQLRLRGLGGLVTIDPAPIPKKERRQIEGALRAALKADSVETIFAGWTPMGNIELQRKRDRPALADILRQEAP
ncbi:ribonuclease E/G [Roseivivax sediminis]|uniref:Ribonuclease, Rne/Rng family n=1 Tax=Roseivivax sediminis TaxID=936889 RepID=A0A1I1W8U6_9RHOB|nr:ribonuclease E/G [Roseivivax sediminis]SFD91419.1 ribonuclease, Rne/Rng family [Roseivivax sediminis]